MWPISVCLFVCILWGKAPFVSSLREDVAFIDVFGRYPSVPCRNLIHVQIVPSSDVKPVA